MHKVSATLLIIDDDEVVRESLAAYLEDSNFKVLQALNGLQGLQIFESEQPDLGHLRFAHAADRRPRTDPPHPPDRFGNADHRTFRSRRDE